jgi:DNA polymerase III subunit gamma/tau
VGGAARGGASSSAAHAPSEPATAAGRTRVAVSAQVEDQPPVAAAATVPGTPEGGAGEAQAAAEQAAAAVSKELASEADPAPTVTAVAVVEPEAETPEPSFAAGVELSLEAFAELWPAVLETLEGDSPMLAAMLREARPAELAGEGLTLVWPESAAFSKRAVEDPAKREVIAQSIRAVTGASLRLAHELRADDELAPRVEQLSEDELVERFKTEFSAVEEPPEEK